MTQRTLQRFVTAGALAATLFLAPAAQARELSSVERAWQWFQGMWSWSAPTPAPSGHSVTKGGGSIDPNGSPRGTTQTSSACTGCDAGPGLDPNGAK